MSNKVNQLEELKSKVQAAKQTADKAQGSLDQIKKSWKDEHEFTSLEEVTTEIDQLTKDIKELDIKYTELLTVATKLLEAIENEDTP